jgi:hypothetical protein
MLGARSERDLTAGDLLARPDDPNDLGAHELDGVVELPRTRAARPCSSRSRPTRMCSVPTYLCLSVRASSCARTIT